MRRYLKALGNLILTDYLEFRWYVGGQKRLTARLADVDTKGSPMHKHDLIRIRHMIDARKDSST